MAALKERAAAGDAAGTLALVMRITQSLQTRSFRQHAGDWDRMQMPMLKCRICCRPDLARPVRGGRTSKL